MALHNAPATAGTMTKTAKEAYRQPPPGSRQAQRAPSWLGCLSLKHCQYYREKYPSWPPPMDRTRRRMAAAAALCPPTAVLAGIALMFVCVLAMPSAALNRLSDSPGSKQRQPPAIYSYSASELEPDVLLGPLLSHRLNKPYSWSNQRLARLMATDDEQAEGGLAVMQSGHGGDLLGDPSDQPDLSLLYATRLHGTKESVANLSKNKRPSRGNARRRPTAAGTKRTAGSKTPTKINSSRPDTKSAPRPPLAAASPGEIHPHAAAAIPSNGTVAKRVSRPKRKNLVCYYGTWAVYRPDAGKFAVEDIDPFLCTHVVYGFTGLSYDNQIKPLDPWNDLEDNYGKGAMKRFTNLKRINPDLKTLVAIGGWNEGSIKYSKMASDPEARARFIASVLQFLDKFDFDGLDLDWEYPASRGGASYDKQNFVKLLKELHEAFKPRQYLLTAAVSAGKWFIDPAYDIPRVSKYLDLINLMAYDYHGGWETKTGMNAPLFGSRQHDRTREEQMLNVNWSVNYWLQMGAPREKLMLGVGSYGRSFTLDKAQVNGLNAPASQKGRAGPYTREPGSLGYNELCEYFKRSPDSWTIVRDPDYLAPYAYNKERQWVGYDDQESLALKAQFAKSMGLGGMMMWSIETDDFRGSCHGEKFPLLNTIRRVIDGTGPGPAPAGTSRPTPKPTSKPAPTGRPAGSSTTSSTKRPGHEVEEEEQQQRPAGSTTSRPVPPTSSARPRPPQPPATPRPPPVSSTSTRRPPVPTSTSTSPAPPPPPPRPPALEFTCREAGMFADRQNCRKFIRCVQMGDTIQKYSFDCPPGTGYNEQQQYCDHLHNVPQCNGNGSTRGAGNRWQSGEIEGVSYARTSSSLPPRASNYPQQPQMMLLDWSGAGSSPGQRLVPLLAVGAGLGRHHYTHYGPDYFTGQQSQQPLIVQWR